MKNTKYWYFTADLHRVSKKTKKSLEVRQFSNVCESHGVLFPIGHATDETVFIMLRNGYIHDGEYCSVRFINQVEISANDYSYLTDKTYNILPGEGELL